LTCIRTLAYKVYGRIRYCLSYRRADLKLRAEIEKLSPEMLGKRALKVTAALTGALERKRLHCESGVREMFTTRFVRSEVDVVLSRSNNLLWSSLLAERVLSAQEEKNIERRLEVAKAKFMEQSADPHASVAPGREVAELDWETERLHIRGFWELELKRQQLIHSLVENAGGSKPVRKTDISQSKTDISQSKTDMSQAIDLKQLKPVKWAFREVGHVGPPVRWAPELGLRELKKLLQVSQMYSIAIQTQYMYCTFGCCR
jgi:hypothetical protein